MQAMDGAGLHGFIAERQLAEAQAQEYARFHDLSRRTGLPLVASHVSALKLLGIEVPERFRAGFDAAAMHVAVGSNAQRRALKGVRLHVVDEALLMEETSAAAADFGVVSPELALAQMASVLDLYELVILGDCMMRRGAQKHTTKEAVIAFVAYHGGFPGRAKLIAAIPLMREDTDSSYETKLRLLAACRGLGSGDVNREIVSRGRSWHGDVVYEELRVILEYDGMFHMTDARQGEHDKEKRGGWRSDGWEVMEVTKGRLRTPESRDALADDIARLFSKALDTSVRALPCIPVEKLADCRRQYRAIGMENRQLDRYFRNQPVTWEGKRLSKGSCVSNRQSRGRESA
ncbi:hypothetical protein [Bifidobacterium leontopitheci]|uniref:hypothetical protein n=1 Tax=Bifidobacterium leontopitheci TaxID=2650774 RepID=UPI001264555F|nr:hypothetical protein [Bifidobacterium leontopitheci]